MTGEGKILISGYSFGLIGYPLGHSFSAKYFSEKFLKENINSEYFLFPIKDISELPYLLEETVSLRGLNVTIPYKEKVIKFLNIVSAAAEKIGAVNVIKISKDSSGSNILSGYNTDYIGFRDSVKPILYNDIKKALVLGTGGASKAVEFALSELGIEVKKVSRNPEKGDISYEDISEGIIQTHKLIINTTPLGMSPNTNDFPPIPYRFISPSHICYDLIYNPGVTAFLRKSAEMGATIKNGLEMLFRQADAAWRIWNTF